MVSSIKNTEDVFDSSDYKRSRNAYTIQCALEYCIAILAGDAFLASLLSHMGISDSWIGVISSFTSVAFLFQLLSIALVQKAKNLEKIAIVMNCLSNVLFMCLYFVPFIGVPKAGKTAIVIFCMLFGYVANYLVNGVIFKWANSYVAPTKRGVFSATKEIISLIIGIVFTCVMGFVIDSYTNQGNIEGGFLFIAVTMLIVNICNFISLISIKRDDNKEEEKGNCTIGDVLKNTLGNRSFRNIVIMNVLWYAAYHMTVGFLGTFKTKDLLISVGAVQIINNIANVVRIFVSRQFGRFSDKHSYATGLKWAMVFEIAALLFIVFTTTKRWWFIIPFTIIHAVSMAGAGQNSFNIVYSYVDEKYIVQAMAIKNSISGTCGFFSSVVGGMLLDHIQGNNNTIFGIHLYGQQLLSIISIVILIITVLFIKLVIEKQRIKVQ